MQLPQQAVSYNDNDDRQTSYNDRQTHMHSLHGPNTANTCSMILFAILNAVRP